jgi:hypothetical protein
MYTDMSCCCIEQAVSHLSVGEARAVVQPLTQGAAGRRNLLRFRRKLC